jgi:hypothetical protein
LLKSWEDLMLGSLTHDEIIVEAKGAFVNQGAGPPWIYLWGEETFA